MCLSFAVLSRAQVSPDGIVPQGAGPINPGVPRVPDGVILVPGAVSSASDSVTPVPEGGSLIDSVYNNRYFGLSYPLSSEWYEKTKGPPPSDHGYYVLAQLRPTPTFKGQAKGYILVTAQDMFFTLTPGANALEVVNYRKDHLMADYKVELPPAATKIAGHPFTFFAYWSPVAELHWYVLATEIRCHTVEISMTSRDTKLLESLVLDLNKMKLPAETGPTAGTGGGDVPVCIKNYATGQNLIEKVDPVFTERRFNPIPVRIIIDKEGRVKHVHFINAFPEQAKAIQDAVLQWRFRPYKRDGQPIEVETGIMFGDSPRNKQSTTAAKPAVTY
jgi:hypothetical protein